jgi:hypothetical protein
VADETDANTPDPKPSDIQVDPYSVASRKLAMLRNGRPISWGTAFFWRAGDGTVFLITNWHNVTGIDSITGDHLSPTGAEPTHVSFPGYPDGDLNEKGEIGRGLYGLDGEPAWLEHPTFGRRVDVVCLKLPDRLRGWVFPINTLDASPLLTTVADDAFVLGYPGGIGPGLFPIWKRGSIATEPDLDVDDLPLMYIDTASSAGMSGSPVIQRGPSGGRMLNGIFQLAGVHTKFLGIYSGRRVPEGNLQAQLGFVWKARVVEEIIQGNVRGSIRSY